MGRSRLDSGQVFGAMFSPYALSQNAQRPFLKNIKVRNLDIIRVANKVPFLSWKEQKNRFLMVVLSYYTQASKRGVSQRQPFEKESAPHIRRVNAEEYRKSNKVLIVKTIFHLYSCLAILHEGENALDKKIPAAEVFKGFVRGIFACPPYLGYFP